MAQQGRVKPQDYTGRQKEKLAAEHAEVVRAREDQLAMATAAQAELDDQVRDLAGDRQVTQTTDDGEVIYVEAPAQTIRVNSTFDMSYGIGNNYSFEEGKQYRVPADIARHLDELGYLWH